MYKASGKAKGAIAMSGGHFGIGTGASGVVDEVREAWKICARVAAILRTGQITVHEFYDKTSKSQATNINTIVAWHKKQSRLIDVSFHLNAFSDVNANGGEALYKQKNSATIAKKINDAIIAASGFKNRGIKARTDLGFLNNLDTTTKPAVLLEPFFCTSKDDVSKYQANFENICFAIAKELASFVGVTLTKVTTQPTQTTTNKEEVDWLMSNVKFASPAMTSEMQYALDSMVKDKLIDVSRADAFRKGTLTGMDAIGVMFVVYARIKRKEEGVK